MPHYEQYNRFFWLTNTLIFFNPIALGIVLGTESNRLIRKYQEVTVDQNARAT